MSQIHPLEIAIGEGWRWLPDVVRHTVVILHRDGAWFEADADWIRSDGVPWAAIGKTAADFASAGGTGEFVTEAETVDGVLTVRCRAVPSLRRAGEAWLRSVGRRSVTGPQ